ncbi:hypothetical protein, partial [Wolbachia endosymbiont of Atemnus politus]|uniref:hypothetical protein n=1 Tax=Wolbachia endosymbiont of Atemnus politus TaxID=2682840 RepID=UPI001C555735
NFEQSQILTDPELSGRSPQVERPTKESRSPNPNGFVKVILTGVSQVLIGILLELSKQSLSKNSLCD